MASKKHNVDYTTFKLSQFDYRDEKEFSNPFLSTIRKLAGVEWRMSPFKPSDKPIHLQVLGNALGFNDPSYKDLLDYHNHRLKAQRKIRAGIYFAISLSLAIPLLVVPIMLLNKTNFSYLLPLLIIVAFLFLVVAAGIAARIAQLVTLRFYSDSLSIQTVLYIIIELARCQNPLMPLQRKKLLGQIDFLETTTRSIIYQYNLNTKSSAWAGMHFRQIESFIQEREQWVIASKNTTLENLQQDFYRLATMYITGNLGDFEYAVTTESINEKQASNIRNFLIGIPRVVIGILLPVLGLLTISWRPDMLTNIIDIKVFGLICIGWLLLAIDIMLKLGIVSSVVGIAKGIKDLA